MPAGIGYSDNQLNAILEMGDLSSAEQEMERQNQLSAVLRGNAMQPSARRDWASQAAKAIQGGMAGASFGKERAANEAFRALKADSLKRARNALFRNANVAAPMASQAPVQMTDDGMEY